MKNLRLSFCVLLLAGSVSLQGQILLSGGLTYSQNFDSLAAASTGSVPWTNNATLPGWYASRAYASSTGAYGPYPYTSYWVDGGAMNNGLIYSYGTNGVNPITERAFGSLSSGTPQTNAWGVRIQNNTTNLLGNATISYTGEQWRCGGNTNTQSMYFTYRTSASPITDPTPGNESLWIPFSALSFNTPTTYSTGMPLDGNAPGNRTIFSNVLLPGVRLNPGDEIFLRWYDINDPGNDHGFAVDDFSVSFAVVQPPPRITTQPTNQIVLAGQRALFSVTASGPEPLSYQWRFYDSAIPGATAASHTITNATLDSTGPYSVSVSNTAGCVTSSVAMLAILQTNDYFNGFDSAAASLSWTPWWGPPLPTLSWDAATDAAANPASGSLKLVEPFTGAPGEQFMTFLTFGGRWPWDSGLVLDGRTCLVFDLRVALGTALSINGDYGWLDLGFTGLPIDWPPAVSLGKCFIPSTATNWTHVVVPINSSSTNLGTITGVYFQIWADGTFTNTLAFNIDNLRVMRPVPSRGFYTVNTFDNAAEVPPWGANLANNAPPVMPEWDPTVDCNNSPSSGSMKLTVNFDTTTYGNSEVQIQKELFAHPGDFRDYTWFMAKVKVSPGSTTTPWGNHGWSGWVFRDQSWTWIPVGGGDIPPDGSAQLDANGWFSYAIYFDRADVPSRQFLQRLTYQFGGLQTGPYVMWIDDIRLGRVAPCQNPFHCEVCNNLVDDNGDGLIDCADPDVSSTYPCLPVITITSTVLAGTNLVFGGTGGLAGGTYYVMASTNVMECITNWVCLATNTFGAGGSFSVTNAVNPSRPRQFFRLKVD